MPKDDMTIDDNPWKTLSHRKVYENPWMQVIENRVIYPTGGKGIYGKVCFKNKAVGIIPIDDQGFTWLVGQHRYTVNEYSWEIPMGGSGDDVDLLRAAQRELREETGLSAARWRQIAFLHTSNSITDEEGVVFIAQDLQTGETDFDETEQLDIQRIPLSQAIRLAMEGKITDAISVAGLFKVALMPEFQPYTSADRSTLDALPNSVTFL